MLVIAQIFNTHLVTPNVVVIIIVHLIIVRVHVVLIGRYLPLWRLATLWRLLNDLLLLLLLLSVLLEHGVWSFVAGEMMVVIIHAALLVLLLLLVHICSFSVLRFVGSTRSRGRVVEKTTKLVLLD